VTSIREDEWLRELEKLSSRGKGDDGFTTREWAEKLGVSVKLASDKLGVAFRQGRLKRGTRNIERMDGKRNQVPVYSILPSKKRK
jgi:hypothetical protein